MQRRDAGKMHSWSTPASQPFMILGALTLAFLVMIVQVLLQLKGAPDFLTDIIGLSILVGALAFAQILDRRMGLVGAVLAGAVAAIVPGVPTIPPGSNWEVLVRLIAFSTMGTVYYVVILALRRRDERTQRQLADLQSLYHEVRTLHAVANRVPVDRGAIHAQISQAATRLANAGQSHLILCNDRGENVASESVMPPIADASNTVLPLSVLGSAETPYIVTSFEEGKEQLRIALTGEQGTIGVLSVERSAHEMVNGDPTNLLAVYAGDAALVLEHIALRERLDHLLIMEERARIARALHDGLAQTLGGIGYRLEYYRQTLTPHTIALMLQDLEHMGIAIHEALHEARRMIHGLRDPLHTDDFPSQLGTLATTIAGKTEICVSVDLPDVLPPLPAAVTETIYAVAQEALQNVVKHAGAETVSLALLIGAEHVEMTISDDGCGFTDTDRSVHASLPHYGIVGMTERAVQQGGFLTIQTEPGMGASITLTLPLKEEDR